MGGGAVGTKVHPGGIFFSSRENTTELGDGGAIRVRREGESLQSRIAVGLLVALHGVVAVVGDDAAAT